MSQETFQLQSPKAGGSRFVRLGPMLTVVALAAIALSGWRYWSVMSTAPPSTFDDSYMFLRYAKHILAGHGHAWNPGGEATYGITSLLYVLLVTVLRWATDLTDHDLIRVASAGMGVSAVVVMVLTAARFTTSSPLRHNILLWAGLLVPTISLSSPFVFHSLTGMDTMLAVFMHSVLIYAVLRLVEKDTTRALWPVILAGYLVFLTRPDSALYAAFFPAAAILLLTSAASRNRRLLSFWAGLGAVLAIDAAIKYSVFGVSVPLPIYTKMHGYYAEYAGLARWNPVEYLLEFCSMILPFTCVAIAFVKRRSLPLLIVFLIPAVLTLGTYFNIVQIMGYRARFSVPSLPFFVIAAVLLLDRFVGQVREAPVTFGIGLAARTMTILSLIVLMPIARSNLPPLYKERLLARAPKSQPVVNPGNLLRLAYWDSVDGMVDLAQRAPSGSLFCMSEYGKVGSAAPETLIYDPLGLHDSQTAHEGFSAEVLFERDPDLIWMPHPDYVAIRRQLLAADEFWSDYEYYPAAFRFGVAVRKTGIHSNVLKSLFAEVWRKHYPNTPMTNHRLTR